MSETQLYRPRPAYALAAIGGALVVLLFAWELGRHFAWATLFFSIVALFFAANNLLSAISHVEVTEAGVTLHRRFGRPRHIEFRQIVTITESGRMTAGISLVYFPLERDGLINLDDPRSIFLPGVERQEELLAIVHREIVE